MSLLLAALACHPGAAPDGKNTADPDPVDVETFSVVVEPMPRLLSLAGSVVADRQVQVSADANGVVERILVDRGQAVRKGELLAVVDPRLPSLSAEASRAQAAAAQIQAELAEKDCARSEQLYADGVIPLAQLERARSQCEAQRKAVEAARASAAMASTSAQKAQVRAPFDGVVGDRMVEVGAFVSTMSPIVALYAEGGTRVRFPVPERHLGLVQVGAQADSVVAAFPGVVFPGQVRWMSPALREQTRDLLVEALPEDPEGRLRPGMFAEVRLTTAEEPAAVVPDGAVRHEGNVAHVFAVVDGRAYDKVVRLGASRGGKTAVLTDLAAGDTVVAAPPETLRDGHRVH